MNIGFKPHYFQQLADLEAANFWFCARNKIILWAINKYQPQFESLLEIGCGTGFVISEIAEYFPTANIFGSEFFEEGLLFARKRVPRAELSQMDARKIPYISRMDVICAFDVLEHIEDDEIVFQQIYKGLKPGGLMLVTVPQHKWLWSDVDVFACHIRRYSAEELHSKIMGAGFKILRSTSFISILLPAMYLSRLKKHHDLAVNVDSMAELRIHPLLNKIFSLLLAIELKLITLGFSIPFGGSRIVVAQKSINF